MRIFTLRLALRLAACVLLASQFDEQGAAAADAKNGKRIAQMRCAPCHIVMPNQRNEIGDSPPFEDIGRLNGFNAEMLAYLILTPHPRMNLTFTREEVEDFGSLYIRFAQIVMSRS